MKKVLTVDIGTTTLKTAVFSEDGVMMSCSHQSLEIIDSFYTDPKQWMVKLKLAISEIKEEIGPLNVEAVIVDGNGPTLTTWPESLARLWLDRRAVDESSVVSKASGSFIDSSFIIPKVLRMKNLEKKLYDDTRWFFGSQDYINFILTGIPTTLMPLKGLEKWYWDDKLLEKLELDSNRFPHFVPMGSIIGTLTETAAKELGLETDVKVIAGCPDFVTSIIGTSTMKAGMVCDRSGTSDGINFCSLTPNDDVRLMSYRHPNGKDYNISGIISTTGEAIAKAITLLGLENGDYEGFYALADKCPQTDVVFCPYLAGERAPLWDPRATGCFAGMTGGVNRSEIARSVCEGIALAIKDVLTAIGGHPSEIRVTGGPAEHDFLNQLKADVTQVPIVTIKAEQPELLGLAIIGFKALGLYSSLQEASSALVKTSKAFYPRTEKAEHYHMLYKKYKEVYYLTKNLPCDVKDN